MGALVCAALAVALSPIAFAGSSDTSVKAGSFAIPGNMGGFGETKCPKGTEVSGGGFIVYLEDSFDGQFHPKSIRPTSGRKWSVEVDSSESTQHDAEADAVCSKGNSISAVSQSVHPPGGTGDDVGGVRPDRDRGLTFQLGPLPQPWQKE